ncbi:lipoprotein-releasing ABC transporter permease subunit [Niveispirillum sp. BGYR6]|uniref:lipoprotein-releasing ABC transporter permease subunit n=1 Tax=Niveispirillum sp. BGYR6 TaxID=2971249 RepID=UPI0022B9B8FE|nr:lipoprotein-releasing ABC transporter permease subunit [Niveispirillum sp. BGYR6]MDG5494648.1 lipoprotein-releasing ABC transporter permease subunit [Niveispirillum sp. BGYR6]
MIFTPFERMVAFRYLRARRQEGTVSVIAGFSFVGVALGVATLIIVMSVMNGFRAQLVARIQGIGAHASITRDGGAIPQYPILVEKLAATPGVVMAMPVVEGQAMATVNGRATGVKVRGLLPEDFKRRPIVGSSVIRGLPDLGDDGVALGFGLSRTLGISVGGEVTLISPKGTPTPFGTMLRRKSFPVYAVVDVRMPDQDAASLYMPLGAAQSFFRLPEQATAIDVFVQNPQDVTALHASLSAAVGPGYRVTDWRQANGSLVTALGVERVAMFIVLTLIILVASFNIISSMVMLVRGKSAAIAILRTMGAAQRSILRVFLLAGASIGAFGTLIGFGLGLVLTLNVQAIGAALSSLPGAANIPMIAFLTGLPAIIDWGEVMLVLGLGLFLSIGATIYPALRAARLDPVEALRHG